MPIFALVLEDQNTNEVVVEHPTYHIQDGLDNVVDQEIVHVDNLKEIEHERP